MNDSEFTVVLGQDEILDALAEQLVREIVADLEASLPPQDRGSARSVIAGCMRRAAARLAGAGEG